MDFTKLFGEISTGIFKFSKEQNGLYNHYKYLYPIEISRESKLESSRLKSQGIPYRERVYLSKIKALQKVIEIDEQAQISDGVWECPVCGIHIKDMGSHIESYHRIKWSNFIRDYNWNKPRIFYTDSHREHLSMNKIHFYNETEEGRKAKERLSEKYSGNKNPSCREEVRLKISRSRKGKSFLPDEYLENLSRRTYGGFYSDKSKSYGYTFWTIVQGKERRFRSKIEYTLYLMMEYYHIHYEYEPYKIEYKDDRFSYLRHYIVDFVVGNRLFEVKDSIRSYLSEDKYFYIQNQLSKTGRKLEILTLSNFFQIFNIPEEEEKPLSFFENEVIKNIRNGECKVVLPIRRKVNTISSFLKKLGEYPYEIIKKGEIIYEDKKNIRSL